MKCLWFSQFRAFLWKVFLQHWRAPVSTLTELLLPCVFMLFLASSYWCSTATEIPATDNSADKVVDMSFFFPTQFCQNISSPRPFGPRLGIPPCKPNVHGVMCFTFVRNGALCVNKISSMPYVMQRIYRTKGPVRIPTLDAYLAFSAYTSYASKRENPSFFVRGGLASMSHYGHLLLAGTGNDTSLAAMFASYCSEVSALCREVVYRDCFFTSMAEAQKFAREHDNEVWAIVELPPPSPASAAAKDEATIFSISMNYTATPSTFARDMKFKDLDSTEYALYITSGFMTLQNVVQQFYIKHRLEKAWTLSPSVKNSSDILEYVNLEGIPLIPMPTPPHVKNSFYDDWVYFMPLVAVFAAIFPVTKLVSWIVEEKLLRIREAMQVMGLRWSCMALGWFVSAFLMNIMASLLVAVILRFSFFHFVHFGVLFMLQFSFMQQNTALSLLLSTLFTNPRAACAVAALCIFVCNTPYYSLPASASMPWLLSMSFLPCFAYAKGVDILSKYAASGYTFSWKNVHEGEYNIALAIGLMWASSGIMWIFWLYLDQVLSSLGGRRRHPLFFISWFFGLFSCCGLGDRGDSESKKRLLLRHSMTTPSREPTDGSVERPLPHGGTSARDEKRAPAALFRNLFKVYHTGGLIGWLYYFITGLRRDGDYCEALRDVSFQLDVGSINVLLGPNGSGKTTLMSVAAGMVTPTRGEVYICGYNTKNQLEKCQRHIGYCPQSDIVWNSLTVEEHLTFYARMKVHQGWDVRKDVDAIIASMQLEEKRHTIAKNLSGGQRRRLCVGVALVGHPNVLFLDEPTSGMDMRGRKAVYDALQKNRETCTVMVSTHLLDEADRVGDRILLMQDGALRGAGSSLFLKSKMDVGYVVTCVVDACSSEMEENMCISRLTEFVRNKSFPGHSHTTSSELQPISRHCKLLGIERRGREIMFRFPLSLLSSSGSTIIRELESQRKELRLRSIGLSLTTLEDVMNSLTSNKQTSMGMQAAAASAPHSVTEHGISIQVEGSTDQAAQTVGTAVGCPASTHQGGNLGAANDEAHNLNNIDEYDKHRGQSFARHFAVLFMKRMHCAKRDVRLLIFQILLPVIFLSLGLLTEFMSPQDQPALTLDASLYAGYETPPFSAVPWSASSVLPDAFAVERSDTTGAFGPYYTPVRVNCNATNCVPQLSAAMIHDIMNHSASRFVAVSLTNLQGRNYSKTSSLMHNISAHHSAPQALNVLYDVANHQLFGKGAMTTVRNVPMQMGPFERRMMTSSLRVVFGIFVLLPLIFIPSNTVAFIVRECQSGARHLQWLAGANVFAFWASSMLFDFCCYLVTEALMLVIFVVFDRTEFIANTETIGATVALFTFFGISSIPFSYVVSFFFSSPFNAQSVVFVINLLLGFLWVMGEQKLLANKNLEGVATFTAHILRIVPAVSLGEGTFALSGVQLMKIMMPGMPLPSLFSFLSISNGKFRGGVGTSLTYLSCTFVVSLVLLVLLEYARIQRATWLFARLSCCKGRKPKSHGDHVGPSASFTDTEDKHVANMKAADSVACEEEEVCCQTTGRTEDGITLQHITKRYTGSDRAAVDDLSLGVHKGEIMALLGSNGAGKTTTVSILAGETIPTSGSAYINHLSVLRSASRSYVGYCPQKDALVDNLSPYEHLRLYAGLRGGSSASIHKEITQLLNVLGLTPQKNAPAYSLSGGNKRRLSLAVALVGGTTSVLLDEPTAGMDATARRRTCAVVKRLTREKSVILTTHLLDETEALADRVAFISGGRLQCVGTPQELKNHYTDDAVYTVRVVFADACGPIDASSDITKRLCASFHISASSEGDDCVVEGIAGRTVTLSVRNSLLHICTVASDIREGKVAGLPPVVQVSATQPTLEEIMLTI
ncbi:ATP-binding cassette protein subfamily A, member 10 [Trypanosoma rangeli]|uniref:ATP-binding cassette protein subfamily A, member 10 n=1 Tax=Trypanosoma rangeli TaxID=5698 RepID=A0A422NUL9_TRYRA|nr:ATP-binding cassette protein subfamily A, member 10 [Trypanosoma rangeli]RNF09148.1 ATP-binding cassette protein subfamily A, member 10 [Trypanosoma rangeli]|eukprot:RNF09148.1 ATP-binding cassette protein subfamily A, member 10 [Trypanosoma rangeli]